MFTRYVQQGRLLILANMVDSIQSLQLVPACEVPFSKDSVQYLIFLLQYPQSPFV